MAFDCNESEEWPVLLHRNPKATKTTAELGVHRHVRFGSSLPNESLTESFVKLVKISRELQCPDLMRLTLGERF